jgi:hypothetical protein
MDTILDFSLNYEQLLNERAKYLTDIIQRAQSELNKIRSILGDANKQSLTTNDRSLLAPPKLDSIPATMPQGIVKPLVIEFLSTHPGKHKTSDIFDYISKVRDVSKEPRRVWVTSVSLALNTLSKGNNPKVKKSDTDNGNVMEYAWIGI